MTSRSLLALMGASLLLAACVSDVNLGDGDGGAGTAGQAGASGQGGGALGGNAGHPYGGSAGTCSAGLGDCDGNASNGCETNLQSNPNNCGACAQACPAASTCVAGKCTAASDAGCSNSDQCGLGFSCVNHQCVPAQDGGVCPSGLADCDADPSNGCETSLVDNPANCGACALQCATGQSCVLGQCVIASDAGCLSGWADCDGDPANGCETSLVDNPANCGACALQCASGQSCVQGQCVIASDAGCLSGWADCDGDPANGCETSLVDNPANCGACGLQCASGQSCVQGQCGVQSDAGCSTGWADCDGNSANGCEANLHSDELNCGLCGNVCAGGQVCSSGVCSLDQDADADTDADADDDAADASQCPAGWGDCDGSSANGCEVNLSSDSNNCGQCGLVCAGGTVCSGGQCTGTCNPFTNTGCQTGWACVVRIPYQLPSDIYCMPAGTGAPDSACSPAALCAPASTCVPEDPNMNGHCREFCDLGGGPHGCVGGDTCKSILHPSIGICAP